MSQITTTTTQTSTVAAVTQTSTTTPAGTVTTTSAITASKTTTVTEPKTLEDGAFFSNPFKSNKLYICNHSDKVVLAVVTDEQETFAKTLSANGNATGGGVSIERTQFKNPPEKLNILADEKPRKVLIGGSHAFVSIFLCTGPDEYIMVFENKRIDKESTLNVKKSHIDGALETQLKYKSSEFKPKEERSSS